MSFYTHERTLNTATRTSEITFSRKSVTILSADYTRNIGFITGVAKSAYTLLLKWQRRGTISAKLESIRRGGTSAKPFGVISVLLNAGLAGYRNRPLLL